MRTILLVFFGILLNFMGILSQAIIVYHNVCWKKTEVCLSPLSYCGQLGKLLQKQTTCDNDASVLLKMGVCVGHKKVNENHFPDIAVIGHENVDKNHFSIILLQDTKR